MCSLEVLEQQASVRGKERRKHKGLDGHELDEAVEGWARRVLEGVSNGVTNHGGLVAVRPLGAKGPSMLTVASLKHITKKLMTKV